MNYWLMKSEPSTWSWEQQVKAGAKGEGWDGVRNYQARNNLQAMTPQEMFDTYADTLVDAIIAAREASMDCMATKFNPK